MSVSAIQGLLAFIVKYKKNGLLEVLYSYCIKKIHYTVLFAASGRPRRLKKIDFKREIHLTGPNNVHIIDKK